jgi:hypothetical protein
MLVLQSKKRRKDVQPVERDKRVAKKQKTNDKTVDTNTKEEK